MRLRLPFSFPAALAMALLSPARAFAGGLEVPDVGAEAIGRGAAFTAKADDGTALTYNVAGLARQRGTRAMLHGTLIGDESAFQRAGAYPDAPTASTPWGGRRFPKSENRGPMSFAPYLAVSSDFGLERLVLAAGVFGPSASATRTFPAAIAGVPNPARYDVVQSDGIIAYPTVAGAYRVTDDIDVGLALHIVYASFDLINMSTSDLGPPTCPNAEYAGCDSQARVRTSGFGFAASLGGMWHATQNLTLGLNVRTPYSLNTTGKLTPTPPLAAPAPLKESDVTFQQSLPLVIRAGVRTVLAREGAWERADLEVDATYENWHATDGTGPVVDSPNLDVLGQPTPVRTTVVHGYSDTFSVRIGGSYTMKALGGDVVLRTGGFYDSSATETATTRLDVDTLEKIGLTLGVGMRAGRVKLDFGYAEIFEPSRTVTDGVIRPENGLKGGGSVDSTGKPLPVVNNGVYEGHMRMIALGISYVLDPTSTPTSTPPTKTSTSRFTQAGARASKLSPRP